MTRAMKRLIFVAVTLFTAITAKAEVREYGMLTLDFAQASKKDGPVNRNSSS